VDTMQSLKIFLSVVGEGSFAAAADRLDLSRAVVSKHVKYLEEYVGTRLLERTTRRVALTELGRTFYERAQRAVGELDEAMLEAGQATVVPRGKIRVTCGVSFGLLHLARAMSAFLDRYPEVTIELDLSDRFVDLGEEGFDLAIRIGALEQSSLIARRLATTRLVVCGSRAYLEQHPMPQAPQQLREHNCLVYSYSPQPKLWTFKRAGEELAIPIEGAVRTNNGDFLRQLALDGRGLAMLPTFMVSEDLKSGRLIHVLSDYDAGELGIYAVYTNRKFLPAKVRSLLDFLVERFRGDAPWAQWLSVVKPSISKPRSSRATAAASRRTSHRKRNPSVSKV
jgi:DNA-binding transcriptional LysR family regulator